MRECLIIQSVDAGYVKYLAQSEPIHRDYADRCDADYRTFIGTKDEGVSPAWNRLPLMLEAFRDGYRKVVWLDADTLVVKPDRDIFAETSDTVPLLMRRVPGSSVEMPWPPNFEDVWNDGVLVTNAGPEAVQALEWTWQRRRFPFLAHHHPTLWELNWLLDYVFAHPEVVGELDDRWNWQAFEIAAPEEEAVIMAWHGLPNEERFARFSLTVKEFYG